MKLLLDHSSTFVTMDMLDGQGRTPLLVHCRGLHYTVDSLSFLLSRRAAIYARDFDGNTCLHLCVRWMMRSDLRDLQRYQIAHTYLIRCGADVSARDNEGRSVSEVTYRNNDRKSAPGNLWDVGLAERGYDVAQFRKLHWPREARYSRKYTRQMFEEMWKGQEHLCPYYHDDKPATIGEGSEWSTASEEDEEDEEDGEYGLGEDADEPAASGGARTGNVQGDG